MQDELDRDGYNDLIVQATDTLTVDRWTDDQAKQFYNSSLWQTKRLLILDRDCHECQACKLRIQTAVRKHQYLHGWMNHIHKATQVHHILPLRQRPDLALDDSNLMSVCPMCHNIIHGRSPFDFDRNKNLQIRKPVTKEKW